MKLLAIGAVAGLTLFGGGAGPLPGGDTRSRPALAKPPYVVDCFNRVETGRGFPPRGWRAHSVVAGPLGLYALRSNAAGHPEDYERPGGVPVESVAIVRRDQQVTLSIPPSEPPGVKLLWLPGFKGNTSITFSACPRWQHRFSGHGRVGRFTLFQGGLRVIGARCTRLEIWAYGRTRPVTRTVGFGRRCPS